MGGQRIVFNPPQAHLSTEAGDGDIAFAGNDPALVLVEEGKANSPRLRHEVQRKALNGRTLGDDHPLFGPALDWAYRSYIVQRLWVDDEHERLGVGPAQRATLGSGPPRPVTARPRSEPDPDPLPLYLFNVLVALEWVPSPQRLRRLEWAFRRASDFLYDVTNGAMAFGQVVFADRSWMGCADIQILASNRFLPRSWVGGLLLKEKYTPIRVGRGLWVRDRRVVAAWDEPEGYRELIHEWAHYALGMKDDYLGLLDTVVDPASGRLRASVGDGSAGATHKLVLPKPRLTSESIMATAAGNSELTAENLDLISDHVDLDLFYPGLRERISGRPEPGPGALPLPLPIFRYVGALAEGSAGDEQALALPFLPSQEATPDRVPFVALDNDKIPNPYWEIYTLRHSAEGELAGITAQGEVDSRTPQHGFTLLGASGSATTVIYGRYHGRTYGWRRDTNEDDTERVRQIWERLKRRLEPESSPEMMALGATEGGEERATLRQELLAVLEGAAWEPMELAADSAQAQLAAPPDALGGSPAANWSVDVVPLTGKEATHSYVKLVSEGLPGGTRLSICSLDGTVSAPAELGSPIELPTLDGYVVAESGGAQLVMPFSQGGGPALAPSLKTNPIAAGSSNGEALLFFYDQDEQQPGRGYADHRVVTTILTGLSFPGLDAVSSAYSVASNLPLPGELHPTLLILNAGAAERVRPADDDTQLAIFRVTDSAQAPERLPTYVPPGEGYAAVSLAAIDGCALMGPPDRNHIERFVLARVAKREQAGEERPAQAA